MKHETQLPILRLNYYEKKGLAYLYHNELLTTPCEMQLAFATQKSK